MGKLDIMNKINDFKIKNKQLNKKIGVLWD